MGSSHDGGDNDCKSVDHFYMKKGFIDVMPKTFSFSKCSVAAIERTIKDLIMPFTKMWVMFQRIRDFLSFLFGVTVVISSI